MAIVRSSERQVPPMPSLPPRRVLLVDGPAAGREVPGSPGRVIRLVRRNHTLVYERDEGAATAFYLGEV